MLQLVYLVNTKNFVKHAQAEYNSYRIEGSGQLIAAFLPLSICIVSFCFTIDFLQVIFVHFFSFLNIAAFTQNFKDT